MSRLAKVMFMLGTSAFLFQLGGCFAKAANDGGVSVFPIGWLYTFFRGAAT